VKAISQIRRRRREEHEVDLDPVVVLDDERDHVERKQQQAGKDRPQPGLRFIGRSGETSAAV
jgi:hypothetical protein